jgi:hypothetical protein
MRPIQYGEDGIMITDAMSQTYHSQLYIKTPKMHKGKGSFYSVTEALTQNEGSIPFTRFYSVKPSGSARFSTPS